MRAYPGPCCSDSKHLSGAEFHREDLTVAQGDQLKYDKRETCTRPTGFWATAPSAGLLAKPVWRLIKTSVSSLGITVGGLKLHTEHRSSTNLRKADTINFRIKKKEMFLF